MKYLFIASLVILFGCSTSEAAAPLRKLARVVNSVRPHVLKKLVAHHRAKAAERARR